MRLWLTVKTRRKAQRKANRQANHHAKKVLTRTARQCIALDAHHSDLYRVSLHTARGNLLGKVPQPGPDTQPLENGLGMIAMIVAKKRNGRL